MDLEYKKRVDDSSNVIRIYRPRITDRGECVRLEADVSWIHREESVHETIFYEVKKQWGKFLASELSDPFVLSMFEIAIENGYDIVYDAPMSEDLKYQMETYLIPAFVKNVQGLSMFKLIGTTSSEAIESECAAGTGFSAGVDSFYTILKHMDLPYPAKRVKYLMLAVNGAAETGINAEIDKKWFEEEMRRFSPLADGLGCRLIGVNSNVSLLNHYRIAFKGGSGITTGGFVHALRKLFGTYYWASAYEAKVLEFRSDDLGYVEPFFLPLLSVNGLRFYHSGAEVNRIEKVEFIADNPIVHKGLTVCGCPKNCGICAKCTRTMAELYAVGKLDAFKDIFPGVEQYEKHFARNLGRELAQDHPPFTTEILDKLHNRKKTIPLQTYLWRTLYFRPFLFLKRKLKYNRFFMRLYYERGWLERLGETRPSEEVIQARLRGERLEK